MTPEEYRRKLAAAMTEKDLLKKVRDMAAALGWRSYHTHDSRRSEPGFPDLVLVRRGRVVFVELKSEKGRLTAAQEQWLEDLQGCSTPTGPVTVQVWRPSDILAGVVQHVLNL